MDNQKQKEYEEVLKSLVRRSCKPWFYIVPVKKKVVYDLCIHIITEKMFRLYVGKKTPMYKDPSFINTINMIEDLFNKKTLYFNLSKECFLITS